MKKKLYARLVRVLHVFMLPVTLILLHNSQRVRVLILAEEHVLLVRSYLGSQRWSIPGGGINKGEAWDTAAVREVQEEVGLLIDKKQLAYIGLRKLSTNAGWSKANVHFYVVNEPRMRPPHVPRPLEIMDAKWWPLKALPTSLTPTLDVALSLQATLDVSS